MEAQLYAALRLAIATGMLKAGDRLLTARQLAVALRISARVSANVYARLEREGLLDAASASGPIVRDWKMIKSPRYSRQSRWDSSEYSHSGPHRE